MWKLEMTSIPGTPASCMVIVLKFQDFKTLSFLLHGYHIPQPQSIAIPATVFSSHNFKILPTFHRGFFSDWKPIFLIFIFYRERKKL